MASVTLDYRLPDTLSNWPWSRNLSPAYKEIHEESSAWAELYQPFDQKGLYSFANCNFPMLASLTFSPSSRDIVRLGSDMMSLWYVFSEYVAESDAAEAQSLRGVVIDALRNPTLPRPMGEKSIGAMARDFIARAIRVANGNQLCLERFLRETEIYTSALVEHHNFTSQQQNQWDPPRLRSLDAYFNAKRPLSGAQLAFCLVEFGLNLPEEVLTHSIITSLVLNAVDLIVIVNDINSYPYARARGGITEQYNIVTVIMNEYRLDLQRALDWLEIHVKKLTQTHLSTMARVPSWYIRGVSAEADDIDRRVGIYLSVLGQWVRGSDDWVFETDRFFGERSMEIKETREVKFQSRQPSFVNGRGRVPKD